MKKLGLAALEDHQTRSYNELGQSLIRQKSNELSTQLTLFKSILLNFLKEHNDELSSDLNVRNEFIKTCSLVGIDPLQIYGQDAGKKMQEFYCELCVRIVEYSNSMRDINGGLMPVEQFLDEFSKMNVTYGDIEKCVEMLKRLNEDVEVVKIGKREYLKNFHIEITTDQNVVFEIATSIGYVTVRVLKDNLGWPSYRAKSVLDGMVGAGYLWVDRYKGETLFWDPAWIQKV